MYTNGGKVYETKHNKESVYSVLLQNMWWDL